MFQFAYVGIAGAGSPLVRITNQSIEHDTAAPTVATAGYRLTSTGKAQKTGNGTSGAYADIADWVIPTSVAANYECRATVVSGSLSSGTTGSWLALTADRTWTVTASFATNVGVIDVEIRDASSTVVMATARITLTAQST